MFDKALERAIARRIKEVHQVPNWYQGSFPKQVAFIEDPARMKAAQCTRRAGKSYGCGIYLCKEAWENPGVSLLYLALTKGTAQRIMWKDVLKTINRRLNLGAKFYDAELKMVFPNGSEIYLEGADAKHDAMDKLLGQKFKLVIVDEASKFRVDVKRLLFDVLKPTLADYEGTMALIGTATDLVNSYFAQITRGEETGQEWKVHHWSALDNPHMRRQFAAEIKRLKEANPNVEAEAWFQQNYLGKWVVNRDVLIYKHNKANTVATLPDYKWTYSLGVTLSYSGHSAFSVVGYSPKTRSAYVVETVSYQDSNLFRAVETIQRLNASYDFANITCAEASKRLVEELRPRFAVSVQEAPAKDKSALIRLMTTEMENGHVKALAQNEALLSEWDSIILDNRTGTDLREHPACVNHLATATLYAWQHCYNYTYQATPTIDDPMDHHWNTLRENIENGEEDGPATLDSLFGGTSTIDDDAWG